MKLHLFLDVSPDDGKAPTHSEVILEDLEAEIENNGLEVGGRVYTVKVHGSGKNLKELHESIRLRRPR